MSFNIESWAHWKYSLNNKKRLMILKTLSRKGIDDPHARSIISKQIDEQSPTFHSFIGLLKKIKDNFDSIDKEEIIEKIEKKIEETIKSFNKKPTTNNSHRIYNNLTNIKKHIKKLIKSMYIEDDNLVIKEDNFFFFNIVIIGIEYLDTSYPIPSIFKINIHRSLIKSSSKLNTQKAEGIKKKNRQTRRKKDRKNSRPSKNKKR